jgi:hypothetical protein
MDEVFSIFLNEFGPPIQKREADSAVIARYEGALPGLLLRYWAEHGFTGYADGLFWTVNPGEYESVLAAALAPTPLAGQDAYHVIARTAFGQLFVWGQRTGSCMRIDPPHGRIFENRGVEALMREGREQIVLESFLMSLQKRLVDFSDDDGKRLFARARKQLGQLAADEMYGFEPALALGGEPALENLEKVKILPHLAILLELAPLRIQTFP